MSHAVPAVDVHERRIWTVWVILEHKKHKSPFKIRHAALYFSYGHQHDTYYFDAGFDSSKFQSQWLHSFDPFHQGVVHSQINLGAMAYAISGRDLVDVLLGVETPTAAQNPEYNCQTWVLDAMHKLYQRAFLSYMQYSKAYIDMQDKITSGS